MNKIFEGDCLEVMKTFPDNFVDSIVTDPPYELGFMGKGWDATGIAYNIDMWRECLRILKPGGYLLSFGGSRTYHRMAVAIEDAGFEIRDMVEWVYFSGFPKSLNVFKHLKNRCTCGSMEAYERATQNTQHNLRPMSKADLSQTINLKEKQGEVLQSGLSEQSLSLQQFSPTENVWKKQSSLERWNNEEKNSRKLSGSNVYSVSDGISKDGEERWLYNDTPLNNGSTPKQITDKNRGSPSHRPQSEQQQNRKPCAFCQQYGTQAIRTLGIGTTLKPSHEPICMARKPLSEKTVAENVLKWRTGGLNIDGSRVDGGDGDKVRKGGAGEPVATNFRGQTKEYTGGRFPANLIHDGSKEVVEMFPYSKSIANVRKNKVKIGLNGIYNEYKAQDSYGFQDDGSAARFFYCAKASKSERGDNNNHPTVKPIALMKYLIKMITPKGGIVLDPFTGSGSTLIATKEEGFNFIGIEKESEYVKIAEARLKAVPERLL